MKAELDVNHCYLQIISVDVYLSVDELKERETRFEQNYNISLWLLAFFTQTLDRFIFETPFTKTGKAHGEMGEQYKRKTILTVEGVFPYMKKRLKVIDKKEVVVPRVY